MDTPSRKGPFRHVTNLTGPEILSKEYINLCLQVVSIFSAQDHPPAQDEYILPPLYNELLNKGDLEEIKETIKQQIPIAGHNTDMELRTRTMLFPWKAKRRNTSVIFSTDPVEQHGPYLNTGTDINISRHITYALNTTTPTDAAPPLNYGSLKWGLGAGASISIRENLHEAMLTRYVKILEKMGYENVFILSTHMARNHLDTLYDLQDTCGSRINVKPVIPLATLENSVQDPHAGYIETALSVHLGLDAQIRKLYQELDHLMLLSVRQIRTLSNLPSKEFIDTCRKIGWSGIVGNFGKKRKTFEEFSRALARDGRNFFNRIVLNCRKEIDHVR